MTRKQIETAIDRFLGTPPSDSIWRELRSSIVRTRAARTNPRRSSSPIQEFVDTLTRHRVTDTVLRRLRHAVAKAGRMR